jgi:hypothetical protein
MIVELRRRGYSYRAIGKAVGMDASGVRRALQRIQDLSRTQALRWAEGLDPDDPAVIAAIDLVRWELSLGA